MKNRVILYFLSAHVNVLLFLDPRHSVCYGHGFPSYLKGRILIGWYLKLRNACDRFCQRNKRPTPLRTLWLVENFHFRQEGCRVFSRLKYLWSKVLRFRYLSSLAVVLNAMDPKVAKLLEGKTDQEKFQAIAFSFRCLLTRPTINSNVDAPMKGKTVDIYSVLGCVGPVALFVAQLHSKWYCSFVCRWTQGEEEVAQRTEIFIRRIERPRGQLR